MGLGKVLSVLVWNMLGEVRALLVGLMADTHDCLPMVEKAIRRLNDEGVELVLHAGDYVSPFVIPKFKDLRARLVGVFGNNDGDHELLKALVEGGFFDVVVHGHSHNAEVYRKGKTLVVNPGEVCGYLSGKCTVAVLDSAKREARLIDL